MSDRRPLPRTRPLTALLSLALAGALHFACGTNETGSAGETPLDAGVTDTGPEVRLDAAVDAAVGDAGAPDAAPPDVGLDAGPKDAPHEPSWLEEERLDNHAAYIPPQCYTETELDDGSVANPCYTCHRRNRKPNYIEDVDLQQDYAFPEYALVNRWSNLFEDRSDAVAAISDEQIRAYVQTSNYFDPDGSITLARVLADVPPAWDDGDGVWSGYVPDCWFDFDEQGFDRDPRGDPTGWRAFGYYPTPGTFWPTNGSTSDVLIRLAPIFRQTEAGVFDLSTYRVNLAILEALIKRKNVAIDPVDESAHGVDLDKDGHLGTASEVVYDWAPLEGRFMSYVGAAKDELERGSIHLAAGLFPTGTEFLHTVRYLDVSEQGEIGLSARLKELRYARKTSWLTYAQLEERAALEVKEKHDFPDRIRTFFGLFSVERGMYSGKAWIYHGFIEAADGSLRPQSFEETAFCMGCHGGVSATEDTIFSFVRKMDAAGPRRGWFHWSQRSLAGYPDRIRADGEGEYAHYLRVNRAGDELRANQEVIARFFDTHGEPNPVMLEALAEDVSVLLLPSAERALRLDKAYRAIVLDQDFVQGRDATVTPAENVHREVEEGATTGVTAPETPPWF